PQILGITASVLAARSPRPCFLMGVRLTGDAMTEPLAQQPAAFELVPSFELVAGGVLRIAVGQVLTRALLVLAGELRLPRRLPPVLRFCDRIVFAPSRHQVLVERLLDPPGIEDVEGYLLGAA